MRALLPFAPSSLSDNMHGTKVALSWERLNSALKHAGAVTPGGRLYAAARKLVAQVKLHHRQGSLGCLPGACTARGPSARAARP